MFNSKLTNANISGVNVKRNGRDRLWGKVLATGKFRLAHDGSFMVQVQDGDTKKEINFSTMKSGLMVYARDAVPFGQETEGHLTCSFWFDGKQAIEAKLPYHKVSTSLPEIIKQPVAGISKLLNSDMIVL